MAHRNEIARADAIALDDGSRRWSEAELDEEVETLAARLSTCQLRVLATLLDNSAAWVLADLAAARAGLVHLPLPTFFTRDQQLHALAATGADALLTLPGVARTLPSIVAREAAVVAGTTLELLLLQARAAPELPAGTSKITFTSGSTGTPKGVCLSADAMFRVAEGVALATDPLAIERHLCALPLAVLLENVVGVLAPRLRGATSIVPPLARLGLRGSSSFDAAIFDDAVAQYAPHSIVLLPQMLRAWTEHLEHRGRLASAGLKLVAVGGAAVGSNWIRRARARGIPVYEGYGLSEGASVQTLNLPGADRPGSAGRPLPHARIRVNAGGELEIAGPLMLGYLGNEVGMRSDWWPTGDVGAIDSEGFVHVHGRRSNILITAFGRNVSPEWVETVLKGESAIAEAIVFGEGRAALRAVLWPSSAEVDDCELDAAVQAANRKLPDYARIAGWTRAIVEFGSAGTTTPNGRPLRGAIEKLHAED